MSIGEQEKNEQAAERKPRAWWKITRRVVVKVGVHVALGGGLDDIGEVIQDTVEEIEEEARQAVDAVEDVIDSADNLMDESADGLDET
ncbi:hypothetical protein [Streptomyces sp. NPDC050804]|uniref:hypothetical protein n=1 Tax=Streptomyces sp. NPDC050804 TaxID=3154745 RepID=UPI0034243846